MHRDVRTNHPEQGPAALIQAIEEKIQHPNTIGNKDFDAETQEILREISLEEWNSPSCQEARRELAAFIYSHEKGRVLGPKVSHHSISHPHEHTGHMNMDWETSLVERLNQQAPDFERFVKLLGNVESLLASYKWDKDRLESNQPLVEEVGWHTTHMGLSDKPHDKKALEKENRREQSHKAGILKFLTEAILLFENFQQEFGDKLRGQVAVERLIERRGKSGSNIVALANSEKQVILKVLELKLAKLKSQISSN